MPAFPYDAEGISPSSSKIVILNPERFKKYAEKMPINPPPMIPICTFRKIKVQRYG